MTGTIWLLVYSALIISLLASAGFFSLHAQRKNKAMNRKRKTPPTCPSLPQQLTGGGNETDHDRQQRCPVSSVRCPSTASSQTALIS